MMSAASDLARRSAALVLSAGALLVAGCEADHGEIRAWMEETRRNTPRVVEKVAEPKRFEPFRYEPSVDPDPFALAKLKAQNVALARASGGPQPDVSRRREPLESFPLDNLRMVGNLRQGASNVALVQVDTALYQVRVGNYVGQNFGRVLRISEGEVAIRETVQDAAGDWVERETALKLQGGETRK
jgi:type IV pilus assembly protein PilP